MHLLQKRLQTAPEERVSISLHLAEDMEDKNTVWAVDGLTFVYREKSFSLPLETISPDEEGQQILRTYFSK